MTILNCWTEPKADDIGRCLSALFYSERGKKIDLDIRTESDHFPCVRYIRLISFGSVGDEVSLMAFEGKCRGLRGDGVSSLFFPFFPFLNLQFFRICYLVLRAYLISIQPRRFGRGSDRSVGVVYWYFLTTID